jgi:hypothetical protein
MKITHIHARVGAFNGFLFFVVDGRLLRVDVGTPMFNDYNEWRISDWNMSKAPYNPDEDDVELTPYKNFPEIEITDKELRMLDTSTSISLGKITDDSEVEAFNAEFPDVDSISGVMYKYQRRMVIYSSEKEIKMTDWDKKKDKTSFEKVFFPILENFRLGCLERLKSKNGN